MNIQGWEYFMKIYWEGVHWSYQDWSHCFVKTGKLTFLLLIRQLIYKKCSLNLKHDNCSKHNCFQIYKMLIIQQRVITIKYERGSTARNLIARQSFARHFWQEINCSTQNLLTARIQFIMSSSWHFFSSATYKLKKSIFYL